MISTIVRKPYLKKVNKNRLITTAEFTLNHLQYGKPFDLAILICSNEEISKLNLQYRNNNKTTDVLSFESFENIPDSGSSHLGDIVISFDYALEHSLRYSHDVSVELSVLLIHGILHLCGFDHSTKKEKQEMWMKQYEIHHLLSISFDHLPGEHD